MIIDAHTHVPLEKQQWPEFLKICKLNDVQTAIASSLGVNNWPEYPSVQALRSANESACEFSAYSGGLVKWLAYLNPQNPNWEEELESCLAKGAIGIKLWISLKSESGSFDKCYPVLKAAGKKDIPVLIHSFNRRVQLFRGEVNTLEIAEMAKCCPETRIIEAHAGSNWHLGLTPLKDLKNVYVDISGYFPQRLMVEKIVEALGPERVLFGSDMFARELSSQISKVLFAQISDFEKELIFNRNAGKVFKLEGGSVSKRQHKTSNTPKAETVDFGVDNFCFCGNWPFLESACDVQELNSELVANNTVAFVANADSIYSADLQQANAKFSETTRKYSRIRPLATINPTSVNWKWILEKSARDFAGALISPYLHDWSLDDEACREFFEKCAEMKFPLWINCGLGDSRLYPKGIDFRPVSQDELKSFAKTAPANKYIFQALSEPDIVTLFSVERVQQDIYCEISRLTDFSGYMQSILARFGKERLVFGSEYPLRAYETVRYSALKIMQYRPSLNYKIKSVDAQKAKGTQANSEENRKLN
jgi:predicted TIM-barrel fold metal-dependent hydrolase